MSFLANYPSYSKAVFQKENHFRVNFSIVFHIEPLALAEYRWQPLLINCFFEIVDTVKNLIKSRLVAKDHILHMVVILYKFRNIVLRWHKAHGPTLCKIIPRPGTTVKLVLERNNTSEQIGICKCTIFDREFCHTIQIVVMS